MIILNLFREQKGKLDRYKYHSHTVKEAVGAVKEFGLFVLRVRHRSADKHGHVCAGRNEHLSFAKSVENKTVLR